MTFSTVGLVTQKKDGKCVAAFCDRIFILSLSFRAVLDNSDSLFWMPSDHVAGSYDANQTKFSEFKPLPTESHDFFFLQFLRYFNP